MNLNQSYKAVNASWEVADFTLWELLSFWEKTLLYFYPKDNTPWCSVENTDFSHLLSNFQKLWITVIWVSKDSIESHQKFISTKELKIDLISDPNLILHNELWAYGEKNNYGKIVQGVIRSTFLLDSEGIILKEWRNIRAKGHAQRVLTELQK